MDRVLLVAVLTTVLCTGAASFDVDASNLACSIEQNAAQTAQCSGGTVIRVVDVVDLTCTGSDQACSPDCGDPGTPVIELNPDRYVDIVSMCERRQSCEPFNETGRVEAVRYTCVNNVSLDTQTIDADETLSELSCAMDTLFVVLAYVVYPTAVCSPAVNTHYHLGAADFRFVKKSCDNKFICDHVKPTINREQACSNKGETKTLIPEGLLIYFSCNPQQVTDEPTPEPTTPLAVTNPSVLTSLSPGSTFTITDGTDAAVSDGGSNDKPGEAAGYTTGIHTGLYAGVPAAVLVVVMVIAVSVICARRKKASQLARNNTGTAAGLDVESSTAGRGNIYSLDDQEYSEVMPVSPRQVGAGLNGSHPSGHPAVLTSPTGRVVLNTAPGSAVRYNAQSAGRSGYPMGDEYAKVQKVGRDPDELIMQDNSTYEATPMTGSRTPGVGATEDTDLVDNSEYAPWEDPRQQPRESGAEDVIVDNPEYAPWENTR